MTRRKKEASDQPLGEAERELRHDAEADREYTTPQRARKADAGQPLEPPEGKDPPARRGEDDQGRPVEREEPMRR
jgi:hypothetical protein